MAPTRSPAFVRLLLVLTFFCHLSFAQSSHGSRHHLHHPHPSPDSTIISSNETSSAGLNGPAALVKQALASLAAINRARIEKPAFNKYEFLEPLDVSGPSLAPPLQVNNGSFNEESAKRSALGARSSANKTSSGPYSIPPELAHAARVVAESAPQEPYGNHSAVAAAMRLKYDHQLNDTNAPRPLNRPEGLLGSFWPDVTPSNSTMERRDDKYWMVGMPQQGASPFGPTDYKVWRDVRAYGARGDGKTDDTAAINRAISDGGRCGPECGASTKVPAVVYFPPGTYLVSSSIIQYYNTQFLGDPHSIPTILAAASFVGLGVITSDVYIGNNEQWYLNTANFLRSIRNFKIDIRLTDPRAYVCGIHWQVAQATSLENIEFYMRYNSDVPENTQQGIYMENGSGGFLADLTFVGGNFGAYFGNQQFTTSHLVFVNCKTAAQVHWDWAWTMHDYIIEGCGNGIVLVGGAAGPKSAGQGVGSLILTDSVIANTENGIVTSLLAENSTSFLLQNVGFFNVKRPVHDNVKDKALVAGGKDVVLESWGFGRIVNSTGQPLFVNGDNIPSMNRSRALLGAKYNKMQPNLFTRRRPKYYDVPQRNIMNVKALGAKGDGVTDDTAVLSSILSGAANTSSIVYFPYGIYIVKDTLRVPIGSRIIGQVWPQIMGKGEKFSDELKPRPVVQVARKGEVGIIEVQDMIFTVAGGTSGAIIVEWNAKEATQGSVGLWDTHIRVGGAAGSDLQYEQCPKQIGKINPACKAASIMLHLTPGSTAYMENVWSWVADHDLDRKARDQIDIYVARGMLIQSELAYLWGTASEHAIMYQYQLSEAQNILMAMIQTESPYFQPTKAPQPYRTGLFADDPTFGNCTSAEERCGVSWAVRIVNSSAVYILGGGLYSWFYNHKQDCVRSEDCQIKAFHVEESYNIWVYNLCTKAIVEMVSPLGSVPTYARDNVNGFLASILAWLQGAKQVSGKREIPGFQVYDRDTVDDMALPDVCKTALTQRIFCDGLVRGFVTKGYRGPLESTARTDSVCDRDCGESLRIWYATVGAACAGHTIGGAVPMMLGANAWAGYNETCLKDPATGRYCNDVIAGFKDVESIKDMPQEELCATCYVKRLAMMQTTPYSIYNEALKEDLEFVYSKCGLTGPTDIPPPAIPPKLDTSLDCGTGLWYASKQGDTCNSVAIANGISSASLFMANQYRLPSCNATLMIPPATNLCLPPECGHTYVLRPEDTCELIEANATNMLRRGDIIRFNPWVGFDCIRLQSVRNVYGTVLCLGPQYGLHNGSTWPDNTTPKPHDPFTYDNVDPPAGSTVAEGTTRRCGRWHVAVEDDSCPFICMLSSIPADLFLKVNSGLGSDPEGCSSRLVTGRAYCVGPNPDWEHPFPTRSEVTAIETYSSRHSGTAMPSTTATSLSYVGCYSEVYGSRAMGNGRGFNLDKPSLELCRQNCDGQTKLVGVQGKLCFCDDKMHFLSTKLADSDCTTPCDADPSRTCGVEPRALSVYGDASAAVPATAPPHMTYTGCYPVTERFLDGPGYVDSKSMTVNSCHKFCLEAHYPIVGLEDGGKCFCGRRVEEDHEKAYEIKCSSPCPGDPRQICGGAKNGRHISIWSADGKMDDPVLSPGDRITQGNGGA